jgi:hypothetical protein
MDKRTIIAAVSAVLLVALNIKLAIDHGNDQYNSGMSHGCNAGFDYFIRQKYQVTGDLPNQVQMEIVTLCVDAIAAGKP